MMKNLSAVFISLLALTTFAACGTPASITVTDAWLRPTLGTGRVSAAYMLINNMTTSDDQLVAVTSPVAASVELHQTLMMNGMMEMEPITAIELPAHGRVELKPGGAHMMLMGLTQELKPGDHVTLTLTFEKAKPLTISAEVRDVGGG
jgi:copper(I)-binding protein